MYINPIIAGIVGTLLVESFIIVFAAILATLTKGEKHGKDNDNQSDQ